jgi:hypothetical protein
VAGVTGFEPTRGCPGLWQLATMLGLLEAACAIPADLEQGGAAASLDWSWAYVLILVERGAHPPPSDSRGVTSPSWFARLPIKISRRLS